MPSSRAAPGDMSDMTGSLSRGNTMRRPAHLPMRSPIPPGDKAELMGHATLTCAIVVAPASGSRPLPSQTAPSRLLSPVGAARRVADPRTGDMRHHSDRGPDNISTSAAGGASSPLFSGFTAGSVAHLYIAARLRGARAPARPQGRHRRGRADRPQLSDRARRQVSGRRRRPAFPHDGVGRDARPRRAGAGGRAAGRARPRRDRPRFDGGPRRGHRGGRAPSAASDRARHRDPTRRRGRRDPHPAIAWPTKPHGFRTSAIATRGAARARSPHDDRARRARHAHRSGAVYAIVGKARRAAPTSRRSCSPAGT